MSAFICSDKQFVLVVLAWKYHTGLNRCADSLLSYANTLKRENIRSVNWRYGESTKFKKIKLSVFDGTWQTPSIEQTVQWLRCIDYQSCERDDYKKSEAFALNMAMQVDLLTEMVGDRLKNTAWAVD